jgi:hypothetical protein
MISLFSDPHATDISSNRPRQCLYTVWLIHSSWYNKGFLRNKFEWKILIKWHTHQPIPGRVNRNIRYVTDWTTEESWFDYQQCQNSFSSPKCPDCLHGPSSHLVRTFPSVKLATPINLAQRLRRRGAIPPISYMISWRGVVKHRTNLAFTFISRSVTWFCYQRHKTRLVSVRHTTVSSFFIASLDIKRGGGTLLGFPHPSRPALAPIQPSIQRIPGISRG